MNFFHDRYYSQEARNYSLLIFTIALSYVCLWRAMEKNTWVSWTVFGVGEVFAFYTHYLSVLALAPTAHVNCPGPVPPLRPLSSEPEL